MSHIGDRIREAMDETGVSSGEIVRAVGMTRVALKGWMDGAVKYPRPEFLFQMARVLKVNPEWLATGDGEKRPTSRALEPSATYVVQSLSAEEKGLLKIFAALSDKKRRALLNFLQAMEETP